MDKKIIDEIGKELNSLDIKEKVKTRIQEIDNEVQSRLEKKKRILEEKAKIQTKTRTKNWVEKAKEKIGDGPVEGRLVDGTEYQASHDGSHFRQANQEQKEKGLYGKWIDYWFSFSIFPKNTKSVKEDKKPWWQMFWPKFFFSNNEKSHNYMQENDVGGFNRNHNFNDKNLNNKRSRTMKESKNNKKANRENEGILQKMGKLIWPNTEKEPEYSSDPLKEITDFYDVTDLKKDRYAGRRNPQRQRSSSVKDADSIENLRL